MALVIAMALYGCGSEEADTTSVDPSDIGTCRGYVARADMSGRAHVDWVPLGLELRGPFDAVVRAADIEDRGERQTITTDQDPDAEKFEQPHLVHLRDATVVVSSADAAVEVLMSPFALADAKVSLDMGKTLLVGVRQPRGKEAPPQPFAGPIAGIGSEGDVTFLGDCVPRWTPAFRMYADQQAATAAELLEAIVADPDSAEAQAFVQSDAANTLAGPE